MSEPPIRTVTVSKRSMPVFLLGVSFNCECNEPFVIGSEGELVCQLCGVRYEGHLT